LLKSKSGEIDPALFKPIIDKVKDLNDSIEGLPDVQTIRTDIVATIKDAAGAEIFRVVVASTFKS